MLRGITTTTFGTTLILQMFKIRTKRECRRLQSATQTKTLGLLKLTLSRKLDLLGFVFTSPEDLAQRVSIADTITEGQTGMTALKGATI